MGNSKCYHYYFKYVVGIGYLQTVFFQWMLPRKYNRRYTDSTLTSRLGKKNVFIIGSIIVFAVNILRYFIPHHSQKLIRCLLLYLWLVHHRWMFRSICQWGMVPDTIEYGHWKTGIRSEGIPLSFFSFMQNLRCLCVDFRPSSPSIYRI